MQNWQEISVELNPQDHNAIRTGVALVYLKRPEKLNALATSMMLELQSALQWLEQQAEIKVIVITGSGRAFAAGAEITEMAEQSPESLRQSNFIGNSWEALAAVKKPTIALVNGYALGGGLELAMMADIIWAAESANFALPEITLGVVPGAGGSQRLPRAIGMMRAMAYILTGEKFSAKMAWDFGLVAKVLPDEELLPKGLEFAEKMAQLSLPALIAAKQLVRQTAELPLTDGIAKERQVFYDLFATANQKEGMRAFLEKRKPKFI